MQLNKGELKAPVNAVHLLTNDLAAVGTGSFLALYSITSGQQLCSPVDVFGTSERIHAFIVSHLPNETFGDNGHGKLQVAVFGAKSVALVEIDLSFRAPVNVLFHRRGRDWVKAVAFLRTGGYIAITAHNRAEVFDSFASIEPTSVFQSEERCFLNSAAIHGDSLESLLIASGTVFGGVVLWQPSAAGPDGVCPVQARLSGHEGVIFHVHFTSTSHGLRVTSVSDDRTIRLWDAATGATTHVLFGHSSRVWMARHVSDTLLVSVSEDTSCRVWQIEPPTADGEVGKYECVAEWMGHSGKNTWCVGVSPDQRLVITGGNDGGVRLWDVGNLSSQRIAYEDQLIHLAPPEENDLAKHFVLAGASRTITLYRSGPLLSYDLLTGECLTLLDASSTDMITGNTTMAATPDGSLVLCGSPSGSLLFASPTAVWEPWTVHHVHAGKIMSVHLIAPPEGGPIWTLSHDHRNALVLGTVDVSTRTWTRRAVLAGLDKCQAILDIQLIGDDALLVCGREGALTMFPLPSLPIDGNAGPVAPVLTFQGGHGKQAVTSAHVTLTSDSTWELMTTGRDGFLVHWFLRRTKPVRGGPMLIEAANDQGDEVFESAEAAAVGERHRKVLGGNVPKHVEMQKEAKVKKKFSSEQTQIQGTDATRDWTWILTKRHKERVTRGWAEKVTVIDSNLILVHFFNKQMILTNHTTQTQLLAIACGGAHRLWHALPLDAHGNALTFGFIRKEQVHVFHTRRDTASPAPPPPKLADALHGREIRCAAFIPTNAYSTTSSAELQPLVVTGSEDTTLALVCPRTMRVLTRINKHTSVVKAMAACRPNLLFTAGGCEELFAWRIAPTASSSSSPPAPPTASTSPVVLYDISKYLPSTATSEARIMALSAHVWVPNHAILVVGFSDGRVQVVLFEDSKHQRFFVIGETNVNKCVLSVGGVAVGREWFALAGTTTGEVSAWPVAGLIEAYLANMATSEFSLRQQALREAVVELPQRSHLRVHQSGVNALDVVQDTEEVGVAEVVTGGDDNAVSVIRLDAAGGWSKVWSEGSAHGSSVTGVKWIVDGYKKLFLSTSVDQRVNVWEAKAREHGHGPVWELKEAVVSDVADVSLLERQRDELIVAGLGMQRLLLSK